MTTAALPTGRPGTAPRGPAGPHPEPNRPGTPTRPAEPPKPSAPSKNQLLAELDCAALLLQTLAVLDLPGMDPIERMRFDLAVRLGRRAVATSSGRDGKDIAAAVASRPVQLPAGRPPVPGGDFRLPRDVRTPDFIGAANYDALVKTSRSG